MLDGGGLSRHELASRVLGYDATGSSHRAVLLGMGRDAAPGHLHYDRRSNKLWADLDLYYLAPGYTREEQLMTDIAEQLGGELRTNPAWAFVGKPITVHSQGGCRMSDDPRAGVTDADGQVRGCPGLYVLDGAALPAPVGVNPSASILAIAERNIELFLRQHPRSAWRDPSSPAARAYAAVRQRASDWVAAQQNWHFAPPRSAKGSPEFRASPLGLRFSEWMDGYYSPTVEGDPGPRDDADYRAAETRGRPGYRGSPDPVGHPIQLELTNTIDDLNV
jgi:cholesterol oxidase